MNRSPLRMESLLNQVGACKLVKMLSHALANNTLWAAITIKFHWFRSDWLWCHGCCSALLSVLMNMWKQIKVGAPNQPDASSHLCADKSHTKSHCTWHRSAFRCTWHSSVESCEWGPLSAAQHTLNFWWCVIFLHPGARGNDATLLFECINNEIRNSNK